MAVASASVPRFGLTFIEARWLRATLEHLAAVAFAAAALLLRVALGAFDKDLLPFSLAFPAVLLATLLGRWTAGMLAVVTAAALGWYLVLQRPNSFDLPNPTDAANLVLFGLSACAVVGAGEWVRRLADELARRTTHYRALFAGMSEGFALCEAIRDEEGKLVDYRVVEANQPLLDMLGVGGDVVGSTALEGGVGDPRWFQLCDQVLRTGVGARIELPSPQNGRWRQIHMSRVTDQRLAQFFIDVTDSHEALAFQARLFDELNHRVKNNLAIVAATLAMQARGGGPSEAALRDAIDRVHAISALHDTLQQGGRQGDVDISDYLSRLCERLTASLLDDDCVRITVQADEGSVSIDDAVPIGIIVNELVTNAVKHAFPSPARGEISVRYVHGAAPRLVIADTGCGIADKSAMGREGMGTRLVETMVKQLGAEMITRTDHGRTVEIHLRAGSPAGRSRAEAADP